MFIAHYHPKKQIEHNLDEHLIAVENHATKFAKNFDPSPLTALAARLHDVGKVHPDFQSYVRDAKGRRGSVKHALPGAYLISKERKQVPKSYQVLMYLLENIISGHHRGLYDLDSRWSKRYDDCSDTGFSEDVKQLVKSQVKRLADSSVQLPTDYIGDKLLLFYAVLTRFSLSAVVDADWLDTEAFFDATRATSRAYEAPSFEMFQQQFHKYMKHFPSSDLTMYRQQVEEKGSEAGSFFELSLPTGYGKTFSSLAFALEHAKTFGKSRIITALPLMNLTSEIGEIYRKIFGHDHVIEDHSSLNMDNYADEKAESKMHLAIENWNRLFIVTTTVQLFESLFSNRPQKLRKIHRLANSVLIVDEYHLLPPNLIEPIFKILDILQRDFDVTVLLVSATSLPLTASKTVDTWGLTHKPRSLLQSIKVPKKVRYDLLGKLNENELISHIDNRSTLIIVNIRKKAQFFYRKVREAYPTRPVFYITTTLAVVHRMERLQIIRQSLEKNERPIVISTQVLEAGVDISFEVLFRELAPLPSIIQAAGRCNRYGKLPQGDVYLFEWESSYYPSAVYQSGVAQLKELLNVYGVEAFSNKEALATNYRRLLSNHKNQQVIAESDVLHFEKVAKRFKMIESTQVDVICSMIDGFKKEWLTEPKTRSWWRKVQPYTVSVPRDFQPQLDEAMIWKGEYYPDIGISLL
ncbi:CRISPR-associated helicase/endonuclease Cas3 [Virgibacillus pantothenticus]|uniref:CRISPR-associated helicase/endonuclease Cas3 n=1 Tax=Virgibacillus pantothenticus TaxID=1473 RepID=UPI0009867F1F|nr:CRISPR-associated helicase/endonuclease Cas3 [Virgibacillus pantothenticus]